MKRPELWLFPVLCLLQTGCMSPLPANLMRDPRVSGIRNSVEEPMDLDVAFAPIVRWTPALYEEARDLGGGGSDSLAVPAYGPLGLRTMQEAGDIPLPGGPFRRELIEACEKLELFSSIDPMTEARIDASLQELLQAASDNGDQFLLRLSMVSAQAGYLGWNNLGFWNLGLWALLVWPAWFVNDEEYTVRLEVEMQVWHVRSQQLRTTRRFVGEATANMNDFDRGMFLIPSGFMVGDATWESVEPLLRDAAEADAQAQVLEYLASDISWEQADGSQIAAEDFALIIGLDEHADADLAPLTCARTDADDFHDMLSRKGKFTSSRTTLLLNEKATRAEIERVLADELPRRTAQNDRVVIYFAGYGASLKNPVAERDDGYLKYLLPYDTDPADVAGSAISMGDFSRWISNLPARNVIVILDCSWGGGSGRLPARTLLEPAGGDVLSESFLQQLTRTPGRFVLTACSVNQKAFENPVANHGLLTGYVLRGMTPDENGYPADASRDGKVTLEELAAYLKDKVRRASQAAANRPQTPAVFAGPNAGAKTLMGN